MKSDASAGLGILRGVVQEVAKNLLQPGRVRIEPQGLFREGNREVMIP
jgi:hypothetical protein